MYNENDSRLFLPILIVESISKGCTMLFKLTVKQFKVNLNLK